MIVNLEKFVQKEESYWDELSTLLAKLQQQTASSNFFELQRLLYLYDRVSADYTKVANYSNSQELIDYLENLTVSAYSFIHNNQKQRVKMHLVKWLFVEFPKVFRQNLRYVVIATTVFMLGGLFGAFALNSNEEAKNAILPQQFANHLNNPQERVKREESNKTAYNAERNSQFAVHLMTNNIKVSILALALGITFGIGTLIVMFYNGVILGLIVCDYLNASQGAFLSGWLLPHGIIEIPAILFAGATGLMIGHCLIKSKGSIKLALRKKRQDIGLFMLAIVVMLLWAGVIEAFMSQVHEPIVTYQSKIMFGILEGILLISWLSMSRKSKLWNFFKKNKNVEKKL